MYVLHFIGKAFVTKVRTNLEKRADVILELIFPLIIQYLLSFVYIPDFLLTFSYPMLFLFVLLRPYIGHIFSE